MCYVYVYDKLNTSCSDYMSSEGGRPITGGSTTDATNSTCKTISSINIWLQTFDKNYI